jgi:hypothetical protein
MVVHLPEFIPAVQKNSQFLVSSLPVPDKYIFCVCCEKPLVHSRDTKNTTNHEVHNVVFFVQIFVFFVPLLLFIFILQLPSYLFKFIRRCGFPTIYPHAQSFSFFIFHSCFVPNNGDDLSMIQYIVKAEPIPFIIR